MAGNVNCNVSRLWVSKPGRTRPEIGKRSDEERGADEENDGHTDLSGSQQSPEAAMMSAASASF